MTARERALATRFCAHPHEGFPHLTRSLTRWGILTVLL